MREKIGLRPELPKRRLRLLLVGALIGVALGRLFDPISGRRRRAELRGRSKKIIRQSARKSARLASYLQGRAQRAAHRHEQPKDFDDVTLADKIKSEVFRSAEVPKGQINVNVQEGLVQLRGEVPRPELIGDLEEQVRRIHGVRDVENLLHPPGVEPQMHQ
jgi:osmotically-inducible protein OsmY